MVLAASPTIVENLAFVANELPWERERAIAALWFVTQRNIDRFHGFKDELNSAGRYDVRWWIKPEYTPDAWQDSAAATSYFFTMEYRARVSVNELLREYCDTEAVRRATLIRTALAACRAEHGEYPEALSALAPDYLAKVPIDPYDMQPFRYVPKGLDLPLTWSGGLQGEEIPPGTPLLWSVGVNDVELVNTVYQVNSSANSESATHEEMDPSDGSKEPVTVEEYLLRSMRPEWYNDPPIRELVFELPK